MNALDWRGADREMTLREEFDFQRIRNPELGAIEQLEATMRLVCSLSEAPLSREEVLGWHTSEWVVVIQALVRHVDRVSNYRFLVDRYGLQ